MGAFVKQERKDRYLGFKSPQDKIRSMPSSLLFSKKSHSERDSVSESTIIFIVQISFSLLERAKIAESV